MATIKIPKIPEDQRTPLVLTLLEVLQLQQEQIQQLKDEIARLKGQKPKPEIKPSKLDKTIEKNREESNNDKRRPGSDKKSKTKKLEIHETKEIKPDNIPEGSKFKDYQDYVVQDIVFKIHNTRYRLERWQTPEGDYLVGQLPNEVLGTHFGSSLTGFILYQYYQAHVTQPLILEELQELGVDISVGQINRIITENKDQFHTEKDDILRVGLEVSGHINVDDTGARHNGKNGYCTHIGNESFAWFESTESKTRINFLKLLCAGQVEYLINVDALTYMSEHGLPKFQIAKLVDLLGSSFENEDKWNVYLQELNIKSKHHVRIVTEGALLGSVIEHGFNKNLVIMSDDAGQFNVFLHALCWVHAERTIHKLVGFNEEQRKSLEETRSAIWKLYADLKDYKVSPSEEKKIQIETRFDEIFTGKTCFATLNQALKRIHKNKEELLLVLDRPDIPLHNNLSESDIREYVKRRKISGSTRSNLGRKCRDTFVSLKKTCRKLKISFWEYLHDRITGKNSIPRLPDLIRLRSQLSNS